MLGCLWKAEIRRKEVVYFRAEYILVVYTVFIVLLQFLQNTNYYYYSFLKNILTVFGSKTTLDPFDLYCMDNFYFYFFFKLTFGYAHPVIYFCL